jgi:hypothetical protein
MMIGSVLRPGPGVTEPLQVVEAPGASVLAAQVIGAPAMVPPIPVRFPEPVLVTGTVTVTGVPTGTGTPPGAPAL